MDWLTLGAFCAALLLCILLNIPILYALAFGLLLFLLYGRRKGFSWGELVPIAFDDVVKVRKLLITFMLIGMLTGLWRAAGTIPSIVCYVSGFIRPSVFLLMAFLLNCGVSMLTGTAFGTAATMGVICATMGAAMGVDMRLVGGAVLSGIFFGDRCSPVSTSALLVSELTKTDIFDNIRRMLRSALLPFLLSCAIYAAVGVVRFGGGSLYGEGSAAGEAVDLYALFGREFRIHWLALIPAIVILVLSLCRVRVQLAMSASILSAVPICLALQKVPLAQLISILFTGYRAADAEVAAMINGGGIISMLKVAGIVCLSASYSGLFEKTGLLDRAKGSVGTLAAHSTSFAALLVTSIGASMIACNQTLAVMLTHQLCGDLPGFTTDDTTSAGTSDLALALEDSAIVISPLIPWSIAGAVPLSSIGAPTSSILLACYLYLLPLWHLVRSFRR
ncbi:MAG: sodium:proton antiporter [Mogibacterium sp.]|nr:sodium:proton antiporter [Mogibacterium sp.]